MWNAFCFVCGSLANVSKLLFFFQKHRVPWWRSSKLELQFSDFSIAMPSKLRSQFITVKNISRSVVAFCLILS